MEGKWPNDILVLHVRFGCPKIEDPDGCRLVVMNTAGIGELSYG